MPSNKTAFAAATDAASYAFKVFANNPMTIIGHGFAGSGDTIDVQISYDDGSTYVDCYRDGTQVQLTDTNNPVTVYGPGLFKVNKGATTDTIGCVLCQEP